MTKKIAFLFPGQGAQFVGMGSDFYSEYPVAKDIFDRANNILKKDITDICFNGPEDELKKTINTQPAIVATSIAILEVLKKELNIEPAYSAGHSLGEYCAMYSASVLDFETTLQSIKKRSELMSEVSGGAMAAVLNATEEQLKLGLEQGANAGYVDIANYNSPVQVVITGDENAVEATSKYLLENGVRRVVPLAVSGAFHSKYMESASEKFNEFVQNIEINDAKFPVITNVDARETLSADEFREKMPKQISSSVYWKQTIEKMISNGVDTFVEIGPGKVLAGLNKKINPSVVTYNIYDKESLTSTVESLKNILQEV